MPKENEDIDTKTIRTQKENKGINKNTTEKGIKKFYLQALFVLLETSLYESLIILRISSNNVYYSIKFHYSHLQYLLLTNAEGLPHSNKNNFL